MIEASREAVQITQEMSFDAYLQDRKLRLAVARLVQIIGEAARRLSPAFRTEHAEIPWARIIAQRNILVHQYERIDEALIWDLTSGKLNALILALESLLPPPPVTEE